MKATELRIGNLFTVDNPKHRPDHSGKTCVVLGIDTTRTDRLFKSGVSVLLHVEGDQYKDSFGQYLEFIKPIPLTEEWAERAGFVCDVSVSSGRIYYRQNELENWAYRLIFSETGIVLEHGFMNSWEELRVLKFVHTLQNVYYSLEDEELEFKS